VLVGTHRHDKVNIFTHPPASPLPSRLRHIASVARVHGRIGAFCSVACATGEDGAAGIVEFRHGGALGGVPAEEPHDGPPECTLLVPDI
jgi:hypothetical protein